MTKEKTAEDGQPEPEAEKPKEKTKKAKPEETASQALDTSALLKKKKSGIIPFKRKQESLCNQTAIYEKRYGVSTIKVIRHTNPCGEVTGLQTMCYPSIMCRRSVCGAFPCARDRGCKGSGISGICHEKYTDAHSTGR